MEFKSLFGFGKPRDAPQIPDIQNNVRDSGTLFVFGKANSGEVVDEKSAMQIATVYACVRLLSESVAQLPLHLFKMTEPDGQEKATDEFARFQNRAKAMKTDLEKRRDAEIERKE